MKLTFLGTGAADWAGPQPDGEERRLTSTLIDDRLLIDATRSTAYALDAVRGKTVLFTHSHSDHYDADYLREIAPKQAYCEASWAAEEGLSALVPGHTVMIDGYSVTPLPASHSTNRAEETPLLFLINDGRNNLLYATDGAWLTNRAYHLIRKNAPLTACVFDGTVGDDYPTDYRVFEHNTLPMVRTMRASLEQQGLLKENAPVIVTHLARTLHPSQYILEAREAAADKPLIIAYDGLEITL